MPSIRTKKQLMRHLRKTVNKASRPVAKTMVDIEKKQIDKVVYKVYTPRVYNRTYALRNSVTDKVDIKHSQTVIQLYHNQEIADHYSLLGQEITDQFGGIIINGAYDLFGTNAVYTKKRDYISSTRAYIKKRKVLKRELIKELKRLGVKAI